MIWNTILLQLGEKKSPVMKVTELDV